MNLLHATGTVSSLKESLFSETKAQASCFFHCGVLLLVSSDVHWIQMGVIAVGVTDCE